MNKDHKLYIIYADRPESPNKYGSTMLTDLQIRTIEHALLSGNTLQFDGTDRLKPISLRVLKDKIYQLEVVTD